MVIFPVDEKIDNPSPTTGPFLFNIQSKQLSIHQLKGVIQQDYRIIHPQLNQRVKGIRTLLEFFAYGEVLDASNSYLIAQPAKSLI